MAWLDNFASPRIPASASLFPVIPAKAGIQTANAVGGWERGRLARKAGLGGAALGGAWRSPLAADAG